MSPPIIFFSAGRSLGVQWSPTEAAKTLVFFLPLRSAGQTSAAHKTLASEAKVSAAWRFGSDTQLIFHFLSFCEVGISLCCI